MRPVTHKPPIPLRNAFDIADLCRNDPCDSNIVLGSFWLGSRTSFESRLAKVFKSCTPSRDFEPHISHLCRFYAALIVERTRGREFDWVARVLSSNEAQPDPSRPQSLLVDVLCSTMGARNATDVFFKSGARPPMRGVERLSGGEALKARLSYLSQDLFIRPGTVSGNILLLDDICNTGASTRVYGAALKRLCAANDVTSVNLAATRFARGKDGRGMLQLDTAGLTRYPSLGQVWLDSAGVFHAREDCESAKKPLACEVRFMAERDGRACADCLPVSEQKPRWWKIW